jgi:SAM-dependent methyltransferase
MSEKFGYDASSYEALTEIEAGSFWFRGRNRLIVWAMRKYAASARSFLEVGCGTGFVLQAIHDAFPTMRLVALEGLTEGFAVAIRRVPSAEFVQADAQRLPYSEEFDAVGAFDVIEHIADDLGALTELRKALRVGGTLFLTVPQHRWLWSVADDSAHHERRYSRKELHSRLHEAGFDVVRMTSFVSLLLPLMVASRLRPQTAREYDGRAEHRGGIANDLMLRVLDVERMIIRAGVSLPAGGSLLVVARRPD